MEPAINIYDSPQFTTRDEAFAAVHTDFPRWFQGQRREQFTGTKNFEFGDPYSGMVSAFRGNGTWCEVHINGNCITHYVEQG